MREGFDEYNNWRELVGLRRVSPAEYARVASKKAMTPEERAVWEAFLDGAGAEGAY